MKKYSRTLLILISVLIAAYLILDQFYVRRGGVIADQIVRYNSVQELIREADLVIEASPLRTAGTTMAANYALTEVKVNKVIKNDTSKNISAGRKIKVVEPYEVHKDLGLIPGRTEVYLNDYTKLKKGSKNSSQNFYQCCHRFFRANRLLSKWLREE